MPGKCSALSYIPVFAFIILNCPCLTDHLYYYQSLEIMQFMSINSFLKNLEILPFIHIFDSGLGV
jgi:hypothetical protein